LGQDEARFNAAAYHNGLLALDGDATPFQQLNTTLWCAWHKQWVTTLH
jgi:hypothetical protein